MKSLVYIIFILNIISFSFCSEIDLKVHQLSGNISVFHGFHVSGKYKLFIGNKDPVNKVSFGDDVIVTKIVEPQINVEFLVEMFQNYESDHIVVSEFARDSGKKIFRNRYYYKQAGGKLVQIQQAEFISKIATAFINIEVAPGYKHPFIKKHTKFLGRDKLIDYYIDNNYYGMVLNTNDTIKYKFGYAYDPSTYIVVGFRIFNDFIQYFDAVTFHYRLGISEVTFRTGAVKIKYLKTKYISTPIWLGKVENEHHFLDKDKAEAYLIKDLFTIRDVKFECVMVDVSERMTPRLFGIDKTVGKTDLWDYTLYEVNSDFKSLFKIRKIIDTEADDLLVHQISEDAEETIVEKYEKGAGMLLVVTSFINGPLGQYRQTRLFKRRLVSWSPVYNEVVGDKFTEMVALIQLLGPIELEISSFNKPTSVYSKEVKTDKNGYYEYYKINEPDEKAVDTEEKYVFGSITDKMVYEQGNIPTDPFLKKELVLARNINKRDIIITNSPVPQSLIHMDHDAYEIIKRNK